MTQIQKLTAGGALILALGLAGIGYVTLGSSSAGGGDAPEEDILEEETLWARIAAKSAAMTEEADPLYAQNEESPVGELQEQFEADSTLPSSSAELVSVDTRLARTPVPAGEAVRAAVVLTVQKGWHVNAHRPTYDYLIGTALGWTFASDLSVENVEYPRPTRLELDFAGDAIDVYEGRVPIFFNVRPASGAAPGERRLTGRLRVQACNDRTCLRPSTVQVPLSIPVAEANATPTSTDDPLFEEASSGQVPGALISVLRRHGLFLAGGVLALGTVLFLVVYSRLASRPAPDEC
jgi:DsbC/DsbD-like thiol-disulfide interchange protein